MKAPGSMSDFTFVTSNDIKVHAAGVACAEFDITFDRENIEFVEIQSSEGEAIARHKASQAYDQLKRPIVVTDDSWITPGLHGFPGPYMKQVNDWFTTDDWLHLTHDLTDRRMILRQIVVYQDAKEQRVFTSDLEAIILHEARSTTGIKHFSIISFDGGKHSAAELVERGESSIRHLQNSWHDLCKWLQNRHS